MGIIKLRTFTMMLILLALVALAAAAPVDQVEDQYDDFDNPEYGDLVEGDIIVDGEEDILLSPLNAVRDPRRKWPGGVMDYYISSSYSSSQRSKIMDGINDLISRTRVNGRKCIDFRARQSGAYVRVEKGSGCSSQVGRTGRMQRLSLANGCFSHGTIMHEFLHAFGFHHEQTRPDRDSWVTIDFGNVRSGMEHNFRKYSTSQVSTLGTPYDYGSVMHYGAYAFAVDRNRPTIRALRSGGSNMGNRSRLSAMDIERVQVHYGCKNARDTEHFQHLAEVPEFNMVPEE